MTIIIMAIIIMICNATDGRIEVPLGFSNPSS